MKAIEDILKIIDNNQEVPIVAEGELVDRINELRQLHLINMVNDRIRLTTEGEEARARGFFRVILNLRFQAEMKAFSSTKLKKHNKIFLCCFALCFSLWFLLILFHMGKVPIGIDIYRV